MHTLPNIIIDLNQSNSFQTMQNIHIEQTQVGKINNSEISILSRASDAIIIKEHFFNEKAMREVNLELKAKINELNTQITLLNQQIQDIKLDCNKKINFISSSDRSKIIILNKTISDL